MNNQNSSPDTIVRPDDLMAELNIKSSTYYDDLKYLSITCAKDESKKAYLTIEQAKKVKALRSHVSKTGKRDGFTYEEEEGFTNSELAINSESSNNELAVNSEQDNIYVEVGEPTENMNIDSLVRRAAELKARELATPDLIVRELANRMNRNDLPNDLQEKVTIAHEAAAPKWTPAFVAEGILSQYRNQSVS